MEADDSIYALHERSKNVFTCEICGFSCRFDAYGRKIDVGFNALRLKEDAFLLKDPFSTSNETPIVLGSPCSICRFTVCVGQSCSYFYEKRYCKPCMLKILQKFPIAVQEEAKKRFTIP